MAVALVVTGAQENLNLSVGGSIVLPAPTSIAAGDVRLHFAVSIGANGAIPGAGSGLTDIGGPGGSNAGGTGGIGCRVQGKVATGSETTITHTAAGTSTGGVAIRATGADTTTPINAAATTTSPVGLDTSAALPTVTTTVNGCLICYWVFGGSATPSIVGPTLILSSFASAGTLLRLYAETQATAGITPARTVTYPTASGRAYGVFAIAPPATGPSGRPKVYVGGSFQSKPLKVWTGTAWVQKPVKVWTGSAWKTLT